MKNLKSAITRLGIGLVAMSLAFIGCKESPVLNRKNVIVNKVALATYLPAKTMYSKYLVVFESGLGDGHSIWTRNDILESVGRYSDYLIYDRGGYENSELDSSEARNISKLSADLAAVIQASSQGRKVILVGHSLGGMIIRDYAVKNPNLVAGILFVDGSHENYNNPTSDQIREISEALKNIPGAYAESLELGNNSNYMRQLDRLPNVPVIAIDSMKIDSTYTEQDRKNWYNAKESLKNGLSYFEHLTTTKSGHYIMLEEPSLVLENILKLLEM